MTQQYQPHEQRVIDEKAELDQRIDKLSSFLATDTFDTLTDEERSLLRRQYAVMVELSVLLASRISLFGRATSGDESDFPLGTACDLSGDGTCEACQ